MTCARSKTKRAATYKIALAVATIALTLLTGVPSTNAAPAAPQGANVVSPSGIKQYQRQFSIGGRLPAAILIVGYEKDAKDVERLFDLLIAKANESFARLDWQNPQGDVARINASAGSGSVKVSDDVTAAFKAAVQSAGWTGGAFDIVVAGDGSYKDISVNEGSSTVELKKSGMQVHLDNMVNGFLAEFLIRYINAANMQNAMVKVGNVFRGIGSAMYGPWKIQVQDDAGTFAHHALNLSVSNTGIATVSASQFRAAPPVDGRTKQPIQPRCKGVTLVMNDAALAEGVAQGVFILGADEGMKLLEKLGKAKALIVDNDGKFMRSPGF